MTINSPSKPEPIASEKTLEENLKNDVYFRYNVLLALNEIKEILNQTREINLTLLKVVTTPEVKKDREGVIKGR